MNDFLKSLPIMPRLHKSERAAPPVATTVKSAVIDEAIVHVTTLATPEEDVLDAFDSGRGIQRSGRIEFRYKPMPGGRSFVEDTSDPFAEPLD